MTLDSSKSYFVDVKGSEVSDSGGTLVDPEVKIFDSSGSAVSGAEDDNGGEGSNARLVFVPPSTGTYYIEVGEHGSDDTGTYTVSVVANSPPRFTGNLLRSTEENRNVYYSLTAVDDDPGDVIYTFGALGGADLSAFHVFPDGSLTLAVAPDFENPHDANQDNVYEMEVVVYSGPQGGAARRRRHRHLHRLRRCQLAAKDHHQNNNDLEGSKWRHTCSSADRARLRASLGLVPHFIR